MSFFHALILGVVEGLTEFLPVSSTAHLILATKVLGLQQTDFSKSFDITIQVGAILAVVFLYWKEFLVDSKVLKRVFTAFVPTAIVGGIFYKIIKRFFLGNESLVLWMLLGGGIFLILFELFYKEKEDAVQQVDDISYGQCLMIGLFQAIAIVPGVSRSAATIIGGLFLGIKRKTIVEFSFLLAVPTMLAASGLDLLKNAHAFSSGQFAFLGVGFLTSFLVAIIAIKSLLLFIKRHNFILFGIYRVLVVLFFFFLFKKK